MSDLYDASYTPQSFARYEQAFPDLTAAEIARISRFGSVNRYADGDMLFTTGKPYSGMYVVLSGHVRVGADVHIGTGAMVAQNISIGRGALVGAGSVVLDDVAEGEFVAGVPARRIARVETARS